RTRSHPLSSSSRARTRPICRARCCTRMEGSSSMASSPWSRASGGMIVTTTAVVEGRPVRDYLGIVTGEVIVGANLFRDIFASITDLGGGRSGQYEQVLARARHEAIEEMTEQARQLGGNAVIGTDLDYEVIGKNGSMLMVSVSGTAVTL